MSRLQDIFNRQTGDFHLTPGEYEGPLVLDRPCTVDGGNSTLWANHGPVLTVTARGVTVKDLRVEVTEEAGRRTAIVTKSGDTVLDNVEVNGDVTGLSSEAEGWDLPSVISLGDFASGEVNAFSYDLTLPADAELACGVKGLRAGPSRLRQGVNRLTLETEAVRDNTILYGELLVRTGVTRRIYVTGKAVSGAPVHLDAMPVSGTLPVSEPLKMDAPPVIPPAAGPEQQVRRAVRGQRMPLSELGGGVLRIAFDWAGVSRPVELDGYVFLLRGDGKVSGDNDLIFFSNPESETGCVKVTDSDGKPLVLLETEKAADWTQKIAVCFSIYGSDPAENFSLVREPCLRLFGGEGESCRFAMDGLGVEKTVVALEVYCYKEEWRVNFVGAGYQSGLETLCRRYGVDVES